ncbi:helix-turn-helix domain-containing protein [Nocardia sp. R7R-8]|uniref:helix-turn-helix domain-containing protein n=1 Tax=Nocardia sp. R7R-8 TaxID=3459304 RepID=UPI00403D55C4
MTTSFRDNDVDLRPEIALGWRRSVLSGLDPTMAVRETPLFDIDRHSRLLRAADPVLTKILDELDDTRFSILLADHCARIVDRRTSNPVLYRYLDAVQAVPGVQYVEEVSGTNSLATAFELRKPIAVAGHEHFLEALRVFCCYGAPIIHPITRRLEGVLDLTGPVEDRSNLLGPFLMRAVRDIEQRLQEGSRLSEQRLFAEFQRESARKKSAIILFGENLALTNAAATDLVSTDDYPALRAFASELGTRGQIAQTLTLSSGRTVAVHARLVDDCRDGVLIEVLPHQPAPAPIRSRARARDHRTILVTGGPGSGRSARARAIAGENATVMNVATELDDSGQWRSRLARALSTSAAVVLDNVHLCHATDAAAIRALLSNAACTVVMVSGEVADAPSQEHAALYGLVDEREGMPSLRDAGHTFPRIVHDVLERLAVGDRDEPGHAVHLRVAPTALAVLAEQDWPGNLSELHHVLRTAANGRSHGDITIDDLPESYRQPALRKLTPLERAERATILSTLAASHGNKAATASALGIGRNTLYQRLRYYQITG